MQADAETTQNTEQGTRFEPNTVSGTLIVAIVLCLICSLVVSTAAVTLKPLQEKNQRNRMRRNVLAAAGLWKDGMTDAEMEKTFESIETVMVNLQTDVEGAPEAGSINEEVDIATYDARKAAKDPAESITLSTVNDPAGIARRENVAPAYLIRNDQGQLETIVLPIYGKGLWSTLYGFLALENDGRTVKGITYYQHGETPGLGGEVDNPSWKAQWPGKIAVNESGQPILDVTKPGAAASESEVDGLSGATITSNGVENMVRFWLGPYGFGPFLEQLRESGQLAAQ